jgi:hypothetical protein
MTDPMEPSAARGARLILLVALVLLVPLGIRVVDAWFGPEDAPPTYLPALEGPRVRQPFESLPIEQLAGVDPGYVVIGDSMAGSRMDYKRFSELSGRGTAPIFQAGSGSVWWYLALKNWVLASGIRPACVFIFFRDTNLTDVMFRLDEGFRWNIDRVARDREDEVNAAIAARVGGRWGRAGRTVESMYGADQARLWVEPAVKEWVGRVLIPSRRQRAAFMTDMNGRFDFLHVRPMEAADLAATVDADADFDKYVDKSVLPLMLRDARAAGVKLCFVRVQRRPAGNQPPPQSPALQQYIRNLRAYIEANGGLLRDEQGDPAITLDMYEDGDHLAAHARAYYTEILYARVRPMLQ